MREIFSELKKKNEHKSHFMKVSGPFANLSCDFNPLVDFIARERSLHTIEFRDFRPDILVSIQKRALIRGPFLCRGLGPAFS